MAGTFGSLGNALSGLRYSQVAMDVASNNVANSGTAGYTRRTVVAQSTGVPAAAALWSRSDGFSGGVEVGALDRMVDPLLDARGRSEHAAQSFLTASTASLVRVETALGEPGDAGLAAALDAFRAGWHDVANEPGDGAARSQLLGRAATLVGNVRAQAAAVAGEWEDQRARAGMLVTEANTLAADLGRLNDSIRVAHVAGTDAGTLLDQRDQLTMRLAELTGARTSLGDDGTAEVRIGGQLYVSGSNVTALGVGGAATLSAAGGDPVTFTLGGAPVGVTSGELGASRELLETTLPGYLSRLDTVVVGLRDAVNGQQALGYDLAGNPGQPLFSGSTAATLGVALSDPNSVAAALTPGTLDGSNADVLGSMDLGAAEYRRLITDFGAEVASVKRQAQSQTVVTAQVDASREAVAGVNIDEEMVALLAAQRAYEGSARVLTVLDSVLDTLINRTGITR